MGRRVTCLWDVCPPHPHILRTIPTFIARMSQTVLAPGSTVSCIHTLWDTPHVRGLRATLSGRVPQGGSPRAKSGRYLCRMRVCRKATTTVSRSKKERGMNLILWLIIGGVLGWIASIIMHTNAQ